MVVRRVARYLGSVRNAVSALSDATHLTAECKADLRGIGQYLSTCESVLMSVIWINMLTMINKVNLVIESRDNTLNVERDNIDKLRDDILNLREKWDHILGETQHVSLNIVVPNNIFTNEGYPTEEYAENH